MLSMHRGRSVSRASFSSPKRASSSRSAVRTLSTPLPSGGRCRRDAAERRWSHLAADAMQESSRQLAADGRSSVEPHVHEARAEAVAVDVLEALDVRRMRDVAGPHREIDVVDLVGEVALDLVDDLAALYWIQLPALGQEQPVQLGVGDVAPVARRAR